MLSCTTLLYSNFIWNCRIIPIIFANKITKSLSNQVHEIFVLLRKMQYSKIIGKYSNYFRQQNRFFSKNSMEFTKNSMEFTKWFDLKFEKFHEIFQKFHGIFFGDFIPTSKVKFMKISCSIWFPNLIWNQNVKKNSMEFFGNSMEVL